MRALCMSATGLNGELLVVGLCFKDAPLNSKYLPRTHKAVLLGYDRYIPTPPPFHFLFACTD